MTAEQNDGGPAFPTEVEHLDNGDTVLHHGMSLRDYFAIHAHADAVASFVGSQADYVRQPISSRYLFADAMLEARKR